MSQMTALCSLMPGTTKVFTMRSGCVVKIRSKVFSSLVGSCTICVRLLYSWRQRGYIEKECREVFYKTELKNKIVKYRCVHNKNKYKCVDCGGSQICGHKKRKYNCPDCISSDFSGAKICEHKRMRAFCKICNSLLSILPDGF